MPTVRRFEELEIWQIARKQCEALFQAYKGTELWKDLELWNQINAASGSVMDNIAEGFDRFSRAEFKQFLVIARGSNAETRSQIYRIKDRGYFSSRYCELLLQTSTNLSVKITNLINHILQSEFKQKPIPDAPPGSVSESSMIYSKTFEIDIPEDQIFNLQITTE